MILLSGHSLTQARRVPLESHSLRLSERESTASIVPVIMDGIGTDSWLLDDTEPGRGIVWRVRSIQTAYATATPTVQLEHVIFCLRDRILFGEHDAAAMGGSDTCTAEQAIRYALSKQSDWRLGRCEYGNVNMPYKFDGDTIYDAISSVTKTLDDPWWDLDTSTYPFVINIIRRPGTVACEMRPGRNLTAISRTIDTSGMYTRFYPIGKDDLHISTEYVSLNEETYGVREKVEVDQELETEAELISWANEQLAKHAHPVVSITAEGLELSAETGESIDKLTLGRICRAPLVEFGTVIEERITQLEYSDKLREPEKVRITMSNQQTDRDILHLLADELKNGSGRGGRGARASSRQNKTDHAWIEDSATHVALVAEKIIGTDAQGKPNWVRLSRLQVDENGIYGEVKTVQNDVVLAQTAIRQNENAITLEAKRAKTAEGELSGRITVEADRITAEVTNRTNADTELKGMLIVESDRVGLVTEFKDGRTILSFDRADHFPQPGNTNYRYLDVSTRTYYEWTGSGYRRINPDAVVNAAGIVASINNDGTSNTRLLGDRVLIGDLDSENLPTWARNTRGLIAEKATIGELAVVSGKINNLTGGTIKENYCGASLVTGTTVTANNTFVHAGDTIYKRAMRWVAGGDIIATVHALGDTTSIILNHSHAMSVDSSGTVTIGDAQGAAGTFNIADTAFYKSRVASAWNSGGATAKVDQISQYAPYGGSVVIKVQYVNNAGNTVDTGRSITIWNSNCSHTFGEKEFSSNGTFYPSTYGYSGFSKVIVSGVRSTQHSNCADSLTKAGQYNVVYVPDNSGTTISIKVKNISAANRYWYYRASEQNLFTGYT